MTTTVSGTQHVLGRVPRRAFPCNSSPLGVYFPLVCLLRLLFGADLGSQGDAIGTVALRGAEHGPVRG